MNNTELNQLLKRAPVPERGADYWDRFPNRVTAEIDRRRQAARAESRPAVPAPPVTSAGNAWSWASAFQFPGAKAAFAFGLAVLCLALGFGLGLWKGQRSPGNDLQLAEVRKYFREIEALFPNQLQAIVFDQQGTHLVLAQEPNLPKSPPLYVKICGPNGCQRVVTFSGQQIRVNGDLCDVLADHRGNVLLVGRDTLWSGAKDAVRRGPYQIEARALEATL